MCGITGEIAAFGIDPVAFYEAHSLLAHRGPDDEGFVALQGDGAVPLRGERTSGSYRELSDLRGASRAEGLIGHHRLSVIDLTEAGHGPFGDPEGRLWLSYNGEVYNYRELRAELESLGHRFRSQTDTEVVLAAWHQWGEGCFARFNGMWALAILDVEARRLILCRDRFGVKPLYWSLEGGRLLFASEIPFLLARSSPAFNDQACAEFLLTSRIDHGTETVLAGISSLAPGHVASYDLDGGGFEVRRWWSLKPTDEERPRDLEGAAAALSKVVDEAVSLRMRADVPVGALLSGGLDSTAIVRNLYTRGLIGPDGLHTFSAVYQEAEHSERPEIEATAAASPGLRTHFIEPPTEHLEDEVRGLIAHHGEPLRSLAVYCQYAVYRQVRELSPVVVLLNGQGADELFCGYTEQRYWLLAELLMRGRFSGFAREVSWLRRHRGIRAATSVASALSRLRLTVQHGEGSHRAMLRDPVLARALRVDVPVPARSPVEARVRSSVEHAPLPEYLRYEDRNSMAFSLETRLPFLDFRIARWAVGLPADLLIHGDETKRVLRRAVASYVPREITRQTVKRGFTVPQEEWQRGHLSGFIDQAVAAADLPFIDRTRLVRAYREYRDGCGDPAFWWRLANLVAWRDGIS